MKLLLPIFFATNLVFAKDEMLMRNLEHRITSLEQSQNGCWTVNPPACSLTSKDWSFYLTLDPLVWKASSIGYPVRTEDIQDQLCKLQFDWDWGMRIGLGFNLPHDGWDILCQWNHFSSTAQNTFFADPNNTISEIQNHSPATSLVSENPSTLYDLSYDFIDLVNGREFYVSKCVTLRPFTGFRSIRTKQTVNCSLPNLIINKEMRTIGIGVRGGIDMQWGFIRNFAFFSNYATNLMYTRHNTVEDRTLENEFNINSSYQTGMSIHDTQLGLRYNWTSCDCCYYFGFDIGWELHFHPGQNQLFNFANEPLTSKLLTNQGDLNVHGFFARARFDF